MPFEIVPSGTHIDFIGKRRLCAALSIGLLLAGVAAGFARGVKFGIDFVGGTEVQVAFGDAGGADVGRIRDVTTRCAVPEASVVRFGQDTGEFLVRFGEPTREMIGTALTAESCPLAGVDRRALTDLYEREAVTDLTGQVVSVLSHALRNAIGPVEVLRVEFVGPRVGDELRRDGISALSIACLLVLAYVALRFSTRFAPGAVVALVHDIGITAAVFVILGLEFDLKVLAALLAIMGYSLNDTIIIYDRIRENMELRTKHDLVDVLNRSVNQTLSRTVLTSSTTLAAVLSLLFLGGEVIRPFAIAMTIGIVVGTYSSIYIAAPTLLWLETRYGDDAGGRSGGGKSGGGKPGNAETRERGRRARG